MRGYRDDGRMIASRWWKDDSVEMMMKIKHIELRNIERMVMRTW